MKEYNFSGKRFTIYSDETSGIGGKYRPTTYGVYDNKRGLCVESTKDYEAAKAKAIYYNKYGLPTNEIKDAAPKFAYPAVKYETGATAHAVNDLILFTDNTQKLATFRDSCYRLLLDRPMAARKINEPYAARQIFMQLFDKARQQYCLEFKHDADSYQHIKNITDKEAKEFCLLYAKDFPIWEKEHA